MKVICTCLAFLIATILSAQTPIEVWKGTVKIASVSEESLYFGFAAGDQLLFDFQEATGKDLKEFEVLEWPRSSKLLEYSKVKIHSKPVIVPHTAIYQFRMANRSIYERVCKLQVWRIPGSGATRNFRTAVELKTVYDTTYTPVDESYSLKDTTILNRGFTVTVNTKNSQYGPHQFPDFDLPQHTIAWSYYIGVNQQGQLPFQEASQQFNPASNISLSKKSGYGPLAALALTGTSGFSRLQKGDNITYSILDEKNAVLARQQQPFQPFRSGNVVNDFGVMKNPLNGRCVFYLTNENNNPVEVMVKIAAIVITEHTAERTVQRMNVQKRMVPEMRK